MNEIHIIRHLLNNKEWIQSFYNPSELLVDIMQNRVTVETVMASEDPEIHMELFEHVYEALKDGDYLEKADECLDYFHIGSEDAQEMGIEEEDDTYSMHAEIYGDISRDLHETTWKSTFIKYPIDAPLGE